jgi:hypothetical protein
MHPVQIRAGHRRKLLESTADPAGAAPARVAQGAGLGLAGRGARADSGEGTAGRVNAQAGEQAADSDDPREGRGHPGTQPQGRSSRGGGRETRPDPRREGGLGTGRVPGTAAGPAAGTRPGQALEPGSSAAPVIHA